MQRDGEGREKKEKKVPIPIDSSREKAGTIFEGGTFSFLGIKRWNIFVPVLIMTST